MGKRVRSNPCHEIRHVNVVELREHIFGARGGGIPPMRVPNMPTPEERTRHEVHHVLFSVHDIGISSLVGKS